ncbi:caspase family protein [Chryseobacterium sp. RP-3-3]|uniref:Caspase family protein n=1 Tax=Chryseobacterium antibioticum TaxID=2728847 RepID=A0A7Y0ANZ7_9FLAO|nr:caspase family protein [Chryseobacterium antibioticum]NML70809.1 caspase family protein [Chryseobacterium antibioticum]
MNKNAMKKLSLCIGINNYDFFENLSNCENDASDLSDILTKFGFESKLLLNLTQDEIIRALREFKLQISENDISLIFFAGHGLKVETDNFLVPKDANIEYVEEIPYKCINAEDLLISNKPANNNLHIIILDACRNNKFPSVINSRGHEIGLNRISAPLGTLISFATSPGTNSLENTGERNSYFTKALLEEIVKPNLTIEQVFRNTRTKVMDYTNGRQVPWEESSLHGEDFVFLKVNSIEIELDKIINRWLTSAEPIDFYEINNLFDDAKVKNIYSPEKLQLLFTLFDIGFERERIKIVPSTIDQDYYTTKRVDLIFPILSELFIKNLKINPGKLDLEKIEIIDEINYGFNFLWTPDESFPQIMANNIIVNDKQGLLSVFVTSDGKQHIVSPIIFMKNQQPLTFHNYGLLVNSEAESFLENYFNKREHLEKKSGELEKFKWD